MHSDLRRPSASRDLGWAMQMVGESGVAQRQWDLSVVLVSSAQMYRDPRKLISPRIVMFCKEILAVIICLNCVEARDVNLFKNSVF